MNIIWALLNILVFAAIINLALRLQKRHSNGSALLFLFFAFIIFPGSVKKEKNLSLNLEKNSALNLDENQVEKIGNFNIKMEDTKPHISYNGIIYKQKNTDEVKVVGVSNITGLVLGYKWKHIAGNMIQIENSNNWNYTLIGVLDYYIWVIPIYSQPKVLTGKLNLKNKELVAAL